MDSKQKAAENKLFEEFPPVTREKWDEAILRDLKGQDYEKNLVWKTGEGFTVKPYYLAEDLDQTGHLNTFPDEFPFIRGHKKETNEWFIREYIQVDDTGEANQKARTFIEKGATSINFVLDKSLHYGKQDMDRLLNGILTGKIEVTFTGGEAAAEALPSIIRAIKKVLPGDSIPGSIHFDPLGTLAISGNFYRSPKDDFDLCKDLILMAKVLPGFRVITVSGDHFHNAGSSHIEELAFSLSAGVEYLHQLTGRGLEIDDIAPAMTFNFAVGSNYFFEIARLRAVRMLWANIVKAYGASGEKSSAMHIHSTTSRWNMTLYDPYVNLLRSTTEAMSAIIGGSDSLTVLPFDSAVGEPDNLFQRLALNQQLLLKEEASLHRVVDPAAGSYYIENLTHSIAAAVWNLFLSIEDKGGFFNAFTDGHIQSLIEATASARDRAIAQRKEILLGTNQYPDFTGNDVKDFSPEVLEKEDHPAGDTLARALHLYRGAEAFERLRLRTDRYAVTHPRPAVFMLTFGNMAMRRARSQFAGNLFGCAGFEIIDNPGFDTIEEGIEVAQQSPAAIIVICSSNGEYQESVPKIYTSLKNDKVVVLAGYPANLAESFKAMGMTHYIHAHSDILHTLEEFQRELHIY
jgi:methylmalonyl-CoA mutase